MASLPYASTLLVFSILFAWFPNPIVPQDPAAAAAAGTTLGSPPAATLADCGPSLLQLASCIPFVQGSVPLPSQPCCGGLKQLYDQQPSCFCLLLNATVFGPFPINSTLAFQLPPLCGLQPDLSACSGVPSPPSPPPPAGSNQVSFGTKPNSTAAAGSPAVTMTPRPAVVGSGLGRSGGAKLQTAASAAAVTSVVWTMAYSYL